MQALKGSRPAFAGFKGVKPAVTSVSLKPASRQALVCNAGAAASPAALPYKAVDGSDKGTQQLSLKVAGDDTAKGLVHRYMVMVQQNARRVRLSAIETYMLCQCCFMGLQLAICGG